MYTIELHDDEFDNEVAGTCAGRIGRGGTIGYAYQVEMHVQDLFDDKSKRWRRAYLKTADDVKVVWVHDTTTDNVRYLARAGDYNGEWELPFVESSDACIAVGVWGREATTDDEALAWATAQLSTAIAEGSLTHGTDRKPSVNQKNLNMQGSFDLK